MGNEHVTIWAVCESEWEQNGPVVAFTSEQLADEHCAELNAEGRYNYAVVALPLLSAAPHRVTWHHSQTSVRADGSVQRYEQTPHDGWRYEHDTDPTLLLCEPRGAVVVNAYATSADVARATRDAAVEVELAKRRTRGETIGS